jgi:hypothetical protein
MRDRLCYSEKPDADPSTRPRQVSQIEQPAIGHCMPATAKFIHFPKLHALPCESQTGDLGDTKREIGDLKLNLDTFAKDRDTPVPNHFREV